MKVRTFAAIAAAACLSFGPVVALAQPAPASPPPSARQLAIAHQILDETGATANMDAMIKSMFGQIVQASSKDLSPDARASAEATSQAMAAAMTKVEPKLIEVSAKAYAQTFSEEELAGMLAFYRTPAGRSMAKKSPALVANIVAATTTLVPDIQSAMATELCARTACPPNLKALANKVASSSN